MLTATYSPEDNKLRLYTSSRLDEETYQRVRKAGFKWAPKQELFVAPAWTPDREDLLIELCGEIDDEDTSLTERAADRAERFSGYRDKRRSEAAGHADTFESGPEVFGHQNAARAERQASRHDRHRTRSVSQWSKAEYWQYRTAGVISHALYKCQPAVRRSRILRLEADQRKFLKQCEAGEKRYNAWKAVAAAPDAETAYRLAYAIACIGGSWHHIHPRSGKESSLYCHLTDSVDPITGYEAAELALKGYDPAGPTRPGSRIDRWKQHYELRLAYENSMLANEGGTAAAAEIEPGGFIGRYQVQKVNKSRATGRVVSVTVLAEDPYWRGEAPAPLKPQKLNIERLGENAYRAPTEAEAQAFAEAQKTAKAKAQQAAKANPKPSLINPTDEDAQRLQDLWNEKARQRHLTFNRHKEYQPTEILRTTQAEYSERSKGHTGRFRTVEVCEHGFAPKTQYGRNIDPSPVACKVRVAAAGFDIYAADRVVILTDKPQKQLPLDWKIASLQEQPQESSTC